MKKLLVIALAAAGLGYGQQSYPDIRVIGGVVTMNGAHTNGGYLDIQPLANNMPAGPCYDEFLNLVQQPIPAVPSFTPGANDLLLWNSLSPEMPTGCGVTPLPVNYDYGINTNGYFYGLAGLATGSIYWNGVQNLRGGMSAQSFTAARYYPGGTTTSVGIMGGGVINVSGVNVTLVSGDPFVGGQDSPAPGAGMLICASLPCGPNTGLGYNVASVTDATHLVLAASAGTLSNYHFVLTLGAYLGGYMYSGHSVGAPAVGTIATATNPLSAGQGLQQGLFYFEDANAVYPTYYPCIRYYNAAVLPGDHFGCIGDISEVYNSFADKASSPATTAAYTTSTGTMTIWGSGDFQGQSYKATKAFNSLADTAGSPSTTAAFTTSTGTMTIWGSGDAQFQTVKATSTFNSLATGSTVAFQQYLGTFTITGAGNASFQSLALTNGLTVDSGAYGISASGVASFASCTSGCGSYTLTAADVAAVEQDLRTSASPSFAAVAAVTFNCTATSTTNCITQSSGTWSVTGAGNAAFQSVAVTSTFNSLATGATSAIQQYLGTFTITGAGNASFQSLALTNGLTVDSGAYGFSGSGALTAVSAAAPIFNCSATGSSNCLQQASGTFHVTGAGDANFQSVTTTNGVVGAFGSFSSLSSSGGLTVSAGGGSITGSFTFNTGIQVSSGSIVNTGGGNVTLNTGVFVQNGNVGYTGTLAAAISAGYHVYGGIIAP